MRRRTLPTRRFAIGLFVALLLSWAGRLVADDAPASVDPGKDQKEWRALLHKGDYDALERIGDDLRATRRKYSNGLSRLWRFAWIGLTESRQEMTEEEYKRTFERMDGWLKAKPKSINARLVLATVWERYGWNARGGGFINTTTEARLNTFAERCAKASKYLDEIAEITKDVDSVYRRMRIELSKDLGEKPDPDLVFDGFKDDPLNMQLTHGMAIALLPRWYGEPGELEAFADEAARRTKETCGDLHYTIAASATKDFVGRFTLETHSFDWKRLQQGFRDIERLYPGAREYIDEEVQFAYMAGDLEAVFGLLEKIGNNPTPSAWAGGGIDFPAFRERFTREMLEGDQKRVLLGHAEPVIFVAPLGAGKATASVGSAGTLRLHELATGKRRGFLTLPGIRWDSVALNSKTGFLSSGLSANPGVLIYSLADGQSGSWEPSQAKVVRTAFSAKGDLLAAADEKGFVAVFNLGTGLVKKEIPAKAEREVTGLTFSSKDNQLAAACASGEVLIFNLDDDKPETTHKVAEKALRSVAWSESHLAVGTIEGEVKVLDVMGKEVAAWKTDPLQVASVAFSPNGENLAIGLWSPEWSQRIANPLFLWRFGQEAAPQPLKGHKLGVNCVCFSDDGKALISGSNDWTVRVWDVP